jgi:hypothetical protein
MIQHGVFDPFIGAEAEDQTHLYEKRDLQISSPMYE